MELKNDFLLFYICLRPMSSDGDPPRSKYIANMLMKIDSKNESLDAHYLRLLLSSLLTFKDQYINN